MKSNLFKRLLITVGMVSILVICLETVYTRLIQADISGTNKPMQIAHNTSTFTLVRQPLTVHLIEGEPFSTMRLIPQANIITMNRFSSRYQHPPLIRPDEVLKNSFKMNSITRRPTLKTLINTYAVLDRVESNGLAVLLLEDLNEEWMVPKRLLPQESAIDTWFSVTMYANRKTVLMIDHQKQKEEKEKTQTLLKQLQR
ncbi:DUF3006 family protein [Lentibacillus saliphilus]|uniref:DUF3006 family protein n=1 Tax=Lentibacillus saliphilus TaxID=2737028 RepID=UPI001C30D35C|nr:DUF3006 family protein [Lentibacillus saliphilus]